MNRKLNKQKQRGGPRGPRRGRNNGAQLGPPEFVPTIKDRRHKFRFLAGSPSTVSITRQNLLNLYVMATTATATARIIEAIRLRKIELWTQPPVLGNPPITAQVEWLGTNSPSIVHSDTAMGVRPAHVMTKPPPTSSNQWWSISGSVETDVLFALTFPTGTVIDITCELRFVEQEAPTAGPVVLGATPGQIYGATLDGNGVSGVLPPIGYTVLP
jgi:hypothetical protein